MQDEALVALITATLKSQETVEEKRFSNSGTIEPSQHRTIENVNNSSYIIWSNLLSAIGYKLVFDMAISKEQNQVNMSND